ncbi:MAG: SPASM domain-containing protein [Planctomycetota bacterium]
MTRLLIVTKDISPGYSDLLKKAIGEAFGDEPSVFSLNGRKPSADLFRELETCRPHIVYFSSLDCLDEAFLDAATEAGAVLATDVIDLRLVCQRGNLYECDRTFCRDARAYDEAKCFATSLEALENGLSGARLFKKALPEGRAAAEAFLGICHNSPSAFKSRFSDGAATARIREQRPAAVRLLTRIDFLICSNPVVSQGLLRFGIDDGRIYTDEGFVPFEGSDPGQVKALKSRAETLHRLYENKLSLADTEMPADGGSGNAEPAVLYRREAKWKVERENSILLMQDLGERRLVWESYPSHIEFSTNNICNLHCAICYLEARTQRLEIGEEETRAICEQVLPRASLLTPVSEGEPLLANLDLLTALCEKYEVQLNVITNGTLLTPDKYKAMRNVLERLQISFDSHKKEIYEKIRKGAKFETVVENIREVCKLAAADNIDVMVSPVMMTLNYDSIAEFIDFVADLGVNSVALQPLIVVSPEIAKWDISANVPAQKIEKEIDRAIEAAERREINLHVWLRESRVFLFSKRKNKICKLDRLNNSVITRHPEICYQVPTYLKIKPDGSVYPCCRGIKETYMGNIKEESLESIWNGKKYQKLRKEFFTGKLRKCCRECPMLGIYSEGITVSDRRDPKDGAE